MKGSAEYLPQLVGPPLLGAVTSSLLPFAALTEAASQHPRAHSLAELRLEAPRARAFQVEETIQAK